MIRVALYERVSTKEQSLHGYSIRAQEETLTAYSNANGYHIVDRYVDDGFSASSSKRPALKRLLQDVQNGEIDLILFTKLDRWFRSVSQYYKIQEILDAAKVAWRAVNEDYTTETTDGRFKVNIMLSVAQQEIDRTSDRIKDVFKYKVQKGEAITGTQPNGYIIENGKPVKDKDTEEIIEAMFDHYETYQSFRATVHYLNARFDKQFTYKTIRNMLKSKAYFGEYKGVSGYYPPYITKERYNEIQRISSINIKQRKNRRVYLFSGLVRCSECGRVMAGNCPKIRATGVPFMSYRCNHSYQESGCINRTRINEDYLETALLEKVSEQLQAHIIEVRRKEAITEKPVNKEEIKEEMERLNFMFQKGRISESDYDKEYSALEKQLLLECKPQKFTKHERILELDFLKIYNELEAKEKQALWRSIIKEIHIAGNDYNSLTIDFL